MDIYSEFLATMASMSGYLLLMGSIVLCLGVVYLMINQRYPVIKFDVIEGKRKITTKRRVLGERVVSDNLIEILLRGQNMLGFSLSEYDYYFVDDKNRRYIATRKGTELVPLKIRDTEIELAELGMGREVAIRYINALDSIKTDLDKQNPIILALVSVIPICVLVLLSGVMFYLILNGMAPMLMKYSAEIAHANENTASSLKDIVEVLQASGVLEKVPIAPQANLTNITVRT